MTLNGTVWLTRERPLYYSLPVPLLRVNVSGRVLHISILFRIFYRKQWISDGRTSVLRLVKNARRVRMIIGIAC